MEGCFSPSRCGSRNGERDWENASTASSVASGAEYTGEGCTRPGGVRTWPGSERGCRACCGDGSPRSDEGAGSEPCSGWGVTSPSFGHVPFAATEPVHVGTMMPFDPSRALTGDDASHCHHFCHRTKALQGAQRQVQQAHNTERTGALLPGREGERGAEEEDPGGEHRAGLQARLCVRWGAHGPGRPARARRSPVLRAPPARRSMSAGRCRQPQDGARSCFPAQIHPFVCHECRGHNCPF